MSQFHHHSRVRLYFAAALTVAAIATSSAGCSRVDTSVSEMPGVNENVRARHFEMPDMQEWAAKKRSVEDASQSLGVSVKAPQESNGKSLKGIYVTEQEPDGAPVDKLQRFARLDYGDFRVHIQPTPNVEAARQLIQSGAGPDLISTGLVWMAKIGKVDAAVVEKGHTDIKTNAAGEVVLPGLTTPESAVTWSRGAVVYAVISGSLSADELLTIAKSIPAE